MGVFEDVIMGGGAVEVRASGDRRSKSRSPDLRVSRTGLSANLWELELVPPIALGRLEVDISALAERAAEPNIFFDPVVLRAAWPRLNSLLAKRGCWMACLWETMGDAPRALRFFVPLAVQKTGWPAKKVLQPLANEFMPIGSPLLDPAVADEACETFLQLLGDPALGLPKVLDLTWMRGAGSVSNHMQKAAKAQGLGCEINRAHDRAALKADEAQSRQSIRDIVGKKTAKEFARLNRRLEETAPVSFHVHTKQEAVLDAFEAFVGLELASWKGRRSTAVYNHKKIASFSREISARLAIAGACEIVEMRHGKRVIASLLLFGRGGDRVTWKIAFAEDLARASPGQQVMAHATLALLHRENFVAADSLAVSDHKMINRMWKGRLSIHDLTISLQPSGNQAMQNCVTAKKRRDNWRGAIKAMVQKIRERS